MMKIDWRRLAIWRDAQRHPTHDVVECVICQSGQGYCSDYHRAYPQEVSQ